MSYSDRLHELVDAVVDGSVSLPGTNKGYYVNYRVNDGKVVSGQWVSKDVHIGPYARDVAEYLAIHWVPGLARYTADECMYTCYVRVALKPRNVSIQGAGPTQEQIEQLLLDKVARDLDTYRRLQEWYSDSNRRST